MESFTRALAAEVPQGAASKWVPTPFCAAVAAAKHFSPIAAPMPQPLPHRVNEPLEYLVMYELFIARRTQLCVLFSEGGFKYFMPSVHDCFSLCIRIKDIISSVMLPYRKQLIYKFCL